MDMGGAITSDRRPSPVGTAPGLIGVREAEERCTEIFPPLPGIIRRQPLRLDREGQSGLLERGVDLSAEVLVLPRHGEARSLDGRFLDAVDPQVVIVVADINRPPDPDLLAMLGGRTVYMTGRDGTLHLTSGGQDFSISKEP